MRRNCPFCQIVRGNLKAHKIAESKNTFSIVDKYPVMPGHSLVVTKKHYKFPLNAPPEIWHEVLNEALKIAAAAKKAMGAKGVQIGVYARPWVPEGKYKLEHQIHMHVVPRKKGDKLDGPQEHSWKRDHPSKKELASVAKKIRAAARTG